MMKTYYTGCIELDNPVQGFVCVGGGELYLELEDKENFYKIHYDNPVARCYKKKIKYPFPILLNLKNYKILEKRKIKD